MYFEPGLSLRARVALRFIFLRRCAEEPAPEPTPEPAPEPSYCEPTRGAPVPGTGRRSKRRSRWPREVPPAQLDEVNLTWAELREECRWDEWEDAQYPTRPFDVIGAAPGFGSLSLALGAAAVRARAEERVRLGYGPVTVPAGPRAVEPVACVAVGMNRDRSELRVEPALVQLRAAVPRIEAACASRGEHELARLVREQAADDAETMRGARRREARQLRREAEGPVSWRDPGDLAAYISDGRSGDPLSGPRRFSERELRWHSQCVAWDNEG